MAVQLTLPESHRQITLDEAQQAAVSTSLGHHLLLGAAGSGRTTTALTAVRIAVDNFAKDKVWVITASRTAAQVIKEKLVEQDAASTPKVMTVSALAYAMLRAQLISQSSGELDLTMLTGPQQEARIRKLLLKHEFNWPERLKGAVSTKVFVSDLRRYLDISQSVDAQHPDQDINNVLNRFVSLLVADSEQSNETTYTQANLAAADLLANGDFKHQLLFSPRAVVVDDLHDFDPSQLRLLIQLIKNAKYSFVTSNSDLAVLGFRGVGIEITKKFRDEIEPKTHLLKTVHRYGTKIGELAADFLPNLVAPDLNEVEVSAIRKPNFAATSNGVVEFEVSASSSIRDALIVDRIMRARVEQSFDFHNIAIVGRSFSSLSNLRRVLAEAAIPVEFAPDNVALAIDPAVIQLIDALKLATADLNQASTEQLIRFAHSDIVGMNASQLRFTAQQLRSLSQFGAPEHVVAAAIKQPSLLSQLPQDPRLQPARRAAVILHGIRAKVQESRSIGEVLWSVWQAKLDPRLAINYGYDLSLLWQNWPTRLAATAKQISAAGRKADRDLDAVLALFDAADRADRNYQGQFSVTDFITELTEQDAASEVLIQRAKTGVAVLTAHRARGREWQLVIVVDLQEGIWPAANVRESIILPRDSSQQRLRLAEERRLAAAAVTSASESVVISIIDSKVDQGTAPSSLLVNYELPEVVTAAPPSRLTVRGLIAQLRAAAIDAESSSELQAAAISRLGFLASQSDPRFSPANPASWWFLPEQTYSDHSITDPSKPIKVSGSMLESITRCPTQWFFERKLGIKDQPVANTVIGLAIHAVAEQIIAQNLDLPAAISELTKLWPTQVFEADWQSQVQFAEATNMVRALHGWLTENQSEIVGTEVSFEVLHADLGVILVGKIDLLQRSPSKELEITDFKTGAQKPTKADLAQSAQLGTYQLAAQIDPKLNPDGLPVSAKLVQVRLRNAKGNVVEQPAPDLADANWLAEQITTAKARLEQEDLPARPGNHCRNCKVRSVCPAVPEGDQVTT